MGKGKIVCEGEMEDFFRTKFFVTVRYGYGLNHQCESRLDLLNSDLGPGDSDVFPIKNHSSTALLLGTVVPHSVSVEWAQDHGGGVTSTLGACILLSASDFPLRFVLLSA